MKLFGRKAARDAGRPFLLGASFGEIGAAWPRSYEGQVREAVLANPVAQRALRLVAEGVGGAPVFGIEGSASRRHFDRLNGSSARTDGAEHVGRGDSSGRTDSGALAVSLVKNGALLETVAAHLLLHGNAFVQVIQDAGGEPVELFALRPERVSVETDGGGWPSAYLYKAGAARTRFAARDGLGRPSILHLKAVHPLDDHYGLGCLGAAAGAVAIHNAATRWNKALLDNAARPSGALVYEPGDGAALSRDQYGRLKAEMEAAFQGAANAGRPMLLEGGLKWQAMSLTPADMDFVGLKATAAREIALAFGVPPMLLGLPGDATYANYREANRALWRLTLLPMLDKILGGISAGLSSWWPGVKLEVDLDLVTALAEDRERLWAQVSAAEFLTADEKREMLGFSPIRHAELGSASISPAAG
ncbi:phage portal protein [Allosphingosinicella vermicomposti]|uniref:phage portal protein n=1 Tax=Allosphingosinicella vermicomposti TaxID=614671 RepID=UPI000D10D171|nr:phage portal protein [Allosphingosinicella vermicomposti]